MTAKIHPSADVHESVKIGERSQVWQQSQVRERAVIGADCKIGKNVYVDFEVTMGDACKIQNNCSVYHGAKLGTGVFIGPHVALLNDKVPRAVNADLTPKQTTDWTVSGVTVEDGAAIGGGSVLLPGVTIGKWALVGSGSVVSRNVPAFAMVYGNPARVVGYVDRDGKRVEPETLADGRLRYAIEPGVEIIVAAGR